MKKWLIIPGFILLIATTVWAYTLQHTGPEIDQGVGVALDVGAANGLIESDGANNISVKTPVTVVTPPGSDAEIPSEKAVVDYVEVSAAGEDNIGANAGAGAGVYRDKSGVTLNFRSLVGGGNISIVQNPDTIEISTPPTSGEANTGNSLGTGEGTVYKDKVGVQLNFRSLRAGNNITITEDANEITINGQAGGGGGEPLANVGTGEGQVWRDTTTSHNLRTIKAGANITIDTDTSTPDTITISAANPGETNTGTNLTGDEGLYVDKLGEVLRFKSLTAGPNINLVADGNQVTISSDTVLDSGTTLPGTCSVGDHFIDTDADGGTGLLYYCSATNTWKASPEVVSGVANPYTLYRDSDAQGPALEDQDTAIVEVNMETTTQGAEDGSYKGSVMRDGAWVEFINVNANTNSALLGLSGGANNYRIDATPPNGYSSGKIATGLTCGNNLSAGDIITLNPAAANPIIPANSSGAGTAWPARGIMIYACTTGNNGVYMTEGFFRLDTWNFTPVAPGHLWLGATNGAFTATDPHDSLASGDIIQIIGHIVSGGASPNGDVAYFDFSRPYSNKK